MNDWYKDFKIQGVYDSNYYYKLVQYLKEWFILYLEVASFKRTLWIQISDVATKDVNKFIWHLKFYEISRLNLLKGEGYRVLLNEWDKPTFFKIFLDKESELLLIEKAINYKPKKQSDSTTKQQTNEQRRTSSQLSING